MEKVTLVRVNEFEFVAGSYSNTANVSVKIDNLEMVETLRRAAV